MNQDACTFIIAMVVNYHGLYLLIAQRPKHNIFKNIYIKNEDLQANQRLKKKERKGCLSFD